MLVFKVERNDTPAAFRRPMVLFEEYERKGVKEGEDIGKIGYFKNDDDIFGYYMYEDREAIEEKFAWTPTILRRIEKWVKSESVLFFNIFFEAFFNLSDEIYYINRYHDHFLTQSLTPQIPLKSTHIGYTALYLHPLSPPLLPTPTSTLSNYLLFTFQISLKSLIKALLILLINVLIPPRFSLPAVIGLVL